MKSAEEILLDELNEHHIQYVEGIPNLKKFILDAMEEYSSQFKPQWISVEDRLPNPGSSVICCLENNTIHQLVFGKSLGFFLPYLFSGVETGSNNVTYWMELPNPPLTGEELEVKGEG